MEHFDESIFQILKFSKRVIDYSCDYIASRILMVNIEIFILIIIILGNQFYWLSNLPIMAQIY